MVYDSVIDTQLYGEIKIGDYFDKIPGVIEIKHIGNEIKHIIADDTTKSVNTNLYIENKKIKYVMRHKVRKRLYKIIVDNNAVTITEDHSIMILRNEKLESIKITDIKPTDKLIQIK